jgi:hypothetical protein
VISEKVDEPIKLTTRVLAVVPALTALVFPLVQEVFDDRFDPYHAMRVLCVRRADYQLRNE